MRGARLLLGATDRVVTAAGYVSALLVLAMTFLIAASVIARTWFATALHADELGGYLTATAATWGFAYALRSGSHVRVDVVYVRLPPRARRYLDHLASIALIVFSSVFTVQAWGVVAAAVEYGSMSVTGLGVPLVIPQALFALGFTVLALEAIVLELTAVLEHTVAPARGVLTAGEPHPPQAAEFPVGPGVTPL